MGEITILLLNCDDQPSGSGFALYAQCCILVAQALVLITHSPPLNGIPKRNFIAWNHQFEVPKQSQSPVEAVVEAVARVCFFSSLQMPINGRLRVNRCHPLMIAAALQNYCTHLLLLMPHLIIHASELKMMDWRRFARWFRNAKYTICGYFNTVAFMLFGS